MNIDEFIDKWLKTFAPDLTKSQYEQYIYNQYMWHAFSFGIIPKGKYCIGKEARKKYDEVNKESAIVYSKWDDIVETMSEKYNTSKKLDKLVETYVIADDFSWTYISTHENDCQGLGPYFMQI